MTLDFDVDEIMASGRIFPPSFNCNPQEDSHPDKNRNELLSLQTKVKPAPWPVDAEQDLPAWSHLEQMKKEANEVAMYSFPSEDHKAVITVINESDFNAPSAATFQVGPWQEDNEYSEVAVAANCGVFERNQRLDFDRGGTEAPFTEESSIIEEKIPSPTDLLQASSASFSEYTSFAKTNSGYVYQIKSRTQSEGGANTSISSSSKHNHDHEGQEHTFENFNQFLDISSMTTNSYDQVVATAVNGNNLFKDQKHGAEVRLENEIKNPGGHWPERLLQAPEMADAPSGILLVFDRMLDCIDPGGRRPEVALPKDEEYVCGYETDLSSTWSVSVNRSWLLKEFEDISITGSTTTDEGSFFRSSNIFKPPLNAEWLDDSLDCIFPCWKEPKIIGVGVEGAPLCKPPRPSPRELAEALEACRKRKWAASEDPEEESSDVNDLKLDENDKGEGNWVHPHVRCGEDRKCDAQVFAEPFRSHQPSGYVDDDDPFDFPPPEFPPLIWKKQALLEIEPKDTTETDADNASGSSLSELFEGLVYGKPSDEKDEGDDDQLQRFLGRTSATEETSNLSYSDGTL